MRTRSQSKISKDYAATHTTPAAVKAEEEKVRSPTQVEDNYPKPVRTKRKTTPPTSRPKKKAKGGPAHSNLATDPFPDWPSPTPEECEEVNKLLSDVHGYIRAPSPGLLSSGKVEGNRSILHSLVRTILSCNTTNANSMAAARGLAEKFPVSGEGRKEGDVVDDDVDYWKVKNASTAEVCEAIKYAGLANVRGRNIKAILDLVYQENLERLGLPSDLAMKEESKSNTTNIEPLNSQTTPDPSLLSLEHLRALSTPDIMAKLLSYPGVGVKVAACVLLFNIGRPVFAVDTHIFRISRWLGWIPPRGSNEIMAFRHLQARIPDGLKYSLHLLLVRHGRECRHCRAVTRSRKEEEGEGVVEECVIEHLVHRTKKRN